MNERIVTWGYDARRRANLSVKGAYDPKKPGPEQVTLQFNHKASDGSGVTVLTDSLGKTTRYSYAQIKGRPQLLEVRGAGCASCGAVNVKYLYDRWGRRSHELQLDAKGQAIKGELYEYDGVDRLVRIDTVRYTNGKPGAPHMRVRYQYGLDPQNQLPTLIARPSVMSGREHVTRIEYNGSGQPLSVTESGFSPLDEAGQPSAEGTPISRTSRYGYSRINGRSVLTLIDGPLPNGQKGTPDDSDVTRIVWDKRGSFITRIEQPGARVSSIEYSDSGQISQVRNAQGRATRFDFSTLGPLERISAAAPGDGRSRAQVFKHDALGRLTESGEQADGALDYRARFAQGYDVADRVQWRASHLGILEQRRYDTEDRVVQNGRFSNAMAQSLSYEFDDEGRLATMRDASGAAYRFSYTPQGRVARVTDAYGDLLPQTARSAQAAPPRKLADDFGRVVAIISADTGRTDRSYDAANRMVASRDVLGNQARYEYDLQGRIVRQTITESRTKAAIETRWKYEGAYLVRLDHPQQSERYAYDTWGMRIAKTVTLHTPEGERSSTTHYEHDARGQVQATSLPDGSRIEYRRNGQGQVVALYRERVQTPWLRWMLPRQVIVKDLQRDIVGIKSYETGNGIEALMQRSRDGGVLARTVYRDKRERHLSARVDIPGISAAHANPPGAMGVPTEPQALLDRRYLWDTRGNLLLRQDNQEQGALGEGYAYDLRNRLLASASTDQFSRFAYDPLGRRVLAQQGKDQGSMQGTVKIGYAKDAPYRWTTARGDQGVRAEYDATGQPQRIGQRGYVWDALGRLVRISEGEKELAAYTYNHRGERVGKSTTQGRTAYLYDDKQLTAELDGQGRITRQYIYLADMPIAAIDTPAGAPLASHDAWRALMRDMQTIAAAIFTSETTLVWLHPNHLGAPEAATNPQGKLLWQASYAPFGQVRVKSDGFMLNMRLPGQYEDAESGLYYNRQRYYDPERGQYLTPDPLGTPDGPNGYAYVAHNPLKYVDPDGLVLFAFDGTGNDESDPNTLSNVVRFKNLYEDKWYYITGPGTKDPITGIVNPISKGGNPADVVGSLTGKERITAMIGYLDEYSEAADDETAFDIDIVGFSRGSAQARDFANQIVGMYQNGYYRYIDKQNVTHCQKVNFRFMGLFDTVLSTHVGSYQLRIPDAFEYVAQAVALNEYRGGTVAFPSESIMGVQASNDRTRIERGFLGSHSDIGGSFPEGDLAKVAMVWMVDQAIAAGVKMNDAPSLHSIIANPVLHDKSSNLLSGAATGGPTASSEDRDVRFMDGSTAKQRQANISGMRWADTTQFIAYKADPNTSDSISAKVDMSAYLQWLNDHGYGIRMTVQ
jgi:RHS repeat-associated protein